VASAVLAWKTCTNWFEAAACGRCSEPTASGIIALNKAIINLTALYLSGVIDSERVAVNQLQPDATL